MSHKEALEDKIPIQKDSKGFNWYYPPCKICGTPVPNWGYIRSANYICSSCRKELVKLEFESRGDLSVDKKEEKLQRALKRIEKVTNIDDYEKAIILVRRGFNNTSWYQSTEEIMVALELVKQGIKAHHQVKVYDYRVDFVIPDLKVALEVDGSIYHNKNTKEIIRDEVIEQKLGDGYEVIRISTENINLNITKLLPAIKAVLYSRKKKSLYKFT
jgi:very-short-patch-repair endonuclease